MICPVRYPNTAPRVANTAASAMNSAATWFGARPTALYTPISRNRSNTAPIMVFNTRKAAMSTGMIRLARPETDVAPREL